MSSVSDQVAGEMSPLSRFRQQHLDNSELRGRFQPKYEEKHLFLACFLVGGLIGFDHSPQKDSNKVHPRLI